MKESSTEASLEEIIPSHGLDKDSNLFDSEDLIKTESNDEIQIEQDKVKMDLLNLDITLTNAADVLHTMDISDRDNYQLIKFQIRVRAVYIYKWVIHHRPEDIKKNLKQMLEETRKRGIKLDEEISEILKSIEELQLEFISEKIKKLEEYYKTLLSNDKMKSLISLKEFFSIGLGSFNQYNNGNKPFEGYALKRYEPYCFKSLITKLAGCIESLAYRFEKK